MILVNGTPYVGALDDPKEFAQFVLTIASDAYYKESGDADSDPHADSVAERRQRRAVDWSLCRLGAIGSAPNL